VRRAGGRGRGSSNLAGRSAGARRGRCAACRGACACSRCARRTRCSSHLRQAWDEGDRDRLQNPGAGRGGEWGWGGALPGVGRCRSPLRVVEVGLKTCDWGVVTSKPATPIVSVKRM